MQFKRAVLFLFLFFDLKTHDRIITHKDVTITTLSAQNLITVNKIKKTQLALYLTLPTAAYFPEKEGLFTAQPSITEPDYSFAVHFHPCNTPEKKQLPLNKQTILLTLPGLGGRASDAGVFASALINEADALVLGTTLDKYPHHQKNPEHTTLHCENFRHGSFRNYLDDPRTKLLGGGLKRMIEEPVQDIIKILEEGVIFTAPDGTSHHVRPYDYGTIIVAGLCVGGLTFIKVQEELVRSHKRPLDGFILDSPIIDYNTQTPYNWVHKKPGFGPPYFINPSLQYLQENGKPLSAYILRGGSDDLCTYLSVLTLLKSCDRKKSQLVTTLPVGHLRCMYNDNYDRTTPQKTPWYKLHGSRQIHSQLMRKWFKKNFQA